MKIRFRVWDGNKMWYPPKREDYTWRIARTGILWRSTAFYDQTSSSKYLNAVAMLSAGVKDGVERWEGDVVKVPYNEVYDFAHYLIIWDEAKAALYTKCLALHHKEKGFNDISKGGYCVGYANELKGSVLGNQYENPELIERRA